MEPDFSSLPEVVWVDILKYLNLTTRAKAARTCHALNNAFNHPSLWHTVQIHLLGDSKSYRYKDQPVILPAQQKHLVRQFGPYIQNLTLKVNGYLKRVPQECQEIISELSRDCRLEKLTLEVGTMVNVDDFHSVTPRDSDLKVFVHLIEHAFRLKSFTLISWPRFYTNTVLDILPALISNPKLVDLEELNLFSYDASRGSWITRNAYLPTPDEVLNVVKHFTRLTHLSLRSTMLSDEIVFELASKNHLPLKYLAIFITYTDQEKATQITAISSKAWKRLHSHCPDLKVHFTVMTRIPFVELACVLNPDVPVHSVNFMRYSRCGGMDLGSITDKYNRTLTKFVDHTDATNNDVELLALVEKCKDLDVLEYNGTLRNETVLQIARFRGHKWIHFKFNADNIITMPEITEDDNVIIRTGPDGTISTPLTRNYESDTERVQRMDELKERVSTILGYTWAPHTNSTFHDL